MYNLKDLRKNIDTYKKKLKDRNIDFDINQFNKFDKINRDLISQKELLEQEKKLLSKSKDRKASRMSWSENSEVLDFTSVFGFDLDRISSSV